MGKKTALHEAAERGDSDSLQRLLDKGTYNVNEENDEKYREGVCLQRERERERTVWTYSRFLILTLFLLTHKSFSLSLSSIILSDFSVLLTSFALTSAFAAIRRRTHSLCPSRAA